MECYFRNDGSWRAGTTGESTHLNHQSSPEHITDLTCNLTAGGDDLGAEATADWSAGVKRLYSGRISTRRTPSSQLPGAGTIQSGSLMQFAEGDVVLPKVGHETKPYHT